MKLSQFFKDADGQFSSKRVFGLACLVVAIVLAFTRRDVAMVGAFLGAASAVFIGQAMSRT